METLLIGGNLDFATPPQNATRKLLPHLANGRQVVLSDLGHADDFWAYEPAAATRLLDTYLDSGKVDTSLYTRNTVDFSPGFSQGAIAKIVLGVLLGLAALDGSLAPLDVGSPVPPGELRTERERRGPVAATRPSSESAAGASARSSP